MKQVRIFFYYYFPPLLWLGIIYYFSSIPNLRTDLPNLLDLILRKIAHLVEFGILAILILRALLQKGGQGIEIIDDLPKQRKFIRKVFITTIILSIFYAFSDEFHQSFVRGREGSLWDVLIDSVGIILGVYFFVRWKLGNEKKGYR